MSVSSSLDLHLSHSTEFSILAAINLLLRAGWSFNYEGTAYFLPIGDDDDFNWQRETIDDTDLLEVFRKRKT